MMKLTGDEVREKCRDILKKMSVIDVTTACRITCRKYNIKFVKAIEELYNKYKETQIIDVINEIIVYSKNNREKIQQILKEQKKINMRCDEEEHLIVHKRLYENDEVKLTKSQRKQIKKSKKIEIADVMPPIYKKTEQSDDQFLELLNGMEDMLNMDTLMFTIKYEETEKRFMIK